MPDAQIATAEDEDGLNAWLHDGSTSWAMLAAVGDGTTVAYQGGPRRLADEVERGWDRWLAEGRPELYDFGLTVTPDRQYAWSVARSTAASRRLYLTPRSGCRGISKNHP